MLNSITNAMHAIALGTYTTLVWFGLRDGKPNYTLLIFMAFMLVFVLKILGMIVHLPWVDRNRSRHNVMWIIISIVLFPLNGFTLAAIGAHPLLLSAGVAFTAILGALYVKSLYGEDWGNFSYLALAMVGIYALCAAISKAQLRVAWIFLVLSNALWMGLARVKWLREYKLHNDVYHLALIASSYYLYSTVSLGLWAS